MTTIPVVHDWSRYPNFGRHEFACPCCDLDYVAESLVDAAQTLRTALGRRVNVSSGGRCFVHNRREGGVWDSRHLTVKFVMPDRPSFTITPCRAMDIWVLGLTITDLVHEALKIPAFKAGEVGAYPLRRFAHLGIARKPDTSGRWGQIQRGGYTSMAAALLWEQENLLS